MNRRKLSWPTLLCIFAVTHVSFITTKLDITFDDEPNRAVANRQQPLAQELATITQVPLTSEASAVLAAQPANEELVVPPAPAESTPQQEPELSETQIDRLNTDDAPLAPEPVVKKKKKKEAKETMIAFDLKDEKLVNVINLIAAKKGINVVLPQAKDDPISKVTVTLEQKKKIPLKRAEQFLYSFLDLAGYTMYPTNGFFVIAKKADSVDKEGREPYHLYVNVTPKDLPQSSESIRAIYYLTNFQVPQSGQTSSERDPLSAILTDIVGKKFFFDPKSNAILITGAADKIASAMNIILELDASGASETVIKFPLFYTSADVVAALIQKQITTVTNKPQGGGRLKLRGETGLYFTPNTRAIADSRTNSLIIIGTEAAANRIKDFVREYIDVPLESGKSILHVVDLQYLDADEFEKVLKQLIDQSKGQTQKEKGGGPQRFFDDVIVIAEKEVVAKEEKGIDAKGLLKVGGEVGKTAGKITLGGNRMLITAKEDDWLVIKELIEQLDKPQLQAIIEVMVVDITLDGKKNISAQTRNPVGLNLHDNMQFQTAHITSQILDTNTNPTRLAADLLRLLGGSPNVSMAVPASTATNSGSLIISLNDPCGGTDGSNGGIWSVLRILDEWTQTKIVSHPFLVTRNNVTASASLSTIRRGAGREVASSGVTTVKQEDFPAFISLAATPRISSLDRMSLQIRVDIQDFIDPNSATFNKITRMVETNASISPGQVLVLGGLIRDNEAEVVTKWPILGDIPILGNLFKSTDKIKIKNNLAIFIHPTIVDPKLRAGQQRFTDDRVQHEKDTMTRELFSSSKQPITRLFFGDMRTRTSAQFLDDYLTGAHYQEPHNETEYNPSYTESDGESVTRAIAITGPSAMRNEQEQEPSATAAPDSWTKNDGPRKPQFSSARNK